MWQDQGVSVNICYSNISDKIDIVDYLKSDELDGPIESIYVIVTKSLNINLMKSLKANYNELQNLGITPK